ncbi:hypothetical protein [Clostridioides difficile]|uniref:hypothetical protein n=1 Tax=Clostridioides difficile TaxID=1496 RepID=UPI001033C5AF|nr:hypothetical protein [Clostridioides difficile]MDB0411705.1 hypothetical protein [Clostridioides difficile]MDB2942827.1 hypothetical protein [Clostridioides difficile]MDB3037664.1 hypothetical protein [Clostridioides difficile]MDB3259603.1 hypothetical protein [Clostridioides difficile]MDB3589070.1 hypothetical protein [Clostridioides difficile]
MSKHTKNNNKLEIEYKIIIIAIFIVIYLFSSDILNLDLNTLKYKLENILLSMIFFCMSKR